MSSTDTDDPPENVPADSSDGATQESLDFNGPDPIGEQISPERRIRVPQDAAPKAVTRPTYFSFGDNGTTATVNAYGRILQICKFSEHARSGFFCVDLPSMAEPYYVKRRMKNILDLIEEPAAGIGIDWHHTFKATGDAIRDRPTVEFIDDRWPLFVFGPADTPKQSHHDEQPQDPVPPTDSQRTTGSAQLGYSGSFKNSRLSLQYLCSGGTMFQRYVLAREMQGPITDASIPTELKLATDLLIRDMDFTEKNSFNATNRGSSYTFEKILDKHGISVIHDTSEEKKPRSFVTLIVQSFGDNTIQEAEDDRGTWCIKLGEGSQQTLKSSGILDVMIAYTIHVQCGTVQSNSPAIHALDSSAAFSSLQNSGFEPLRFSSHPHLDFTIRRNLEHILSVCSIPVAQLPVRGSQRKAEVIALTCGDISGHRVALSASFFAFQFLIYADRYLGQKKSSRCSCNSETPPLCQAYACQLRDRIQEACFGHLIWVFRNTEAVDNRFSLHYWATGRAIDDKTGLPLPSPADAALQILKIFDPSRNKHLYKKWNERMPDLVEESICERIHAWAYELDQGDKRKNYAFARHSIDNREKFRLSDHVRIYSVFRLIQRYKDDPPPEPKPLLLDGPDTFVSENFNADVVRKNVLKRFTTKDPVSQQRMLATTRTASTTRFLFHSKDTALFYAMSDGVFTEDRDRKDEDDDWDQHDLRWRRTMDCQGKHEEAWWPTERKPLRFALMVIAGSKGRTLNTFGPENGIKIATQALLNSSSPNGLFPGLLGGDLEPITFRKELLRDDYWHATFEIPYIVWRYGQHGLEKKDRSPKHTRVRSVVIMQDSDSKFTEPGMPRKKTTPFVNLDKYIDRKGFVEITDDWLQQGPKALDFKFERRFWTTSPDCINVKPEDLNNVNKPALGYALKHLKDSPRPRSGLDKDVKGVVVDVPRRVDKREEEGLSQELVTFNDLAKKLGEPRTVNKAKKRLIWLPHGDWYTAALCYLATPPDGRVDIVDFFDRHASYRKYFVDEASAFLNEWNTELHISFYRLSTFATLDGLSRGFHAIPELSYVIPNISSWRKEGAGKKDEYGSKGITRASMSFRFVGDFFDRYWTCHFLEYIPDDRIISGIGLEKGLTQIIPGLGIQEKRSLKDRLLAVGCDEVEDPQKEGRKRFPWQQRRVLELLLLYQMLQEVHDHTQKILTWIKQSILEDPPIFSARKLVEDMFSNKTRSSPPNSLAKALEDCYEILRKSNGDQYFSVVDRWKIFEQILRTIEEDLSHNLALIEEWNRREKERESESPRWTRNDERTFRPTINKLRTKTQRQFQKLGHLRAGMSEFRDLVSGLLASIREERSFRGSENINLFTYVTVVFLPLGFATGIFSMSSFPDKSTLLSMVELALIAIALTIFALANAQTSGKAVVNPVISLLRGINDLLFHPLIRLVFHLIWPFGGNFSSSVSFFSDWSDWFSYVGLLMRQKALFLFYRFLWIPMTSYIDEKTETPEALVLLKEILLEKIKPPSTSFSMAQLESYNPFSQAQSHYRHRHKKATQNGPKGSRENREETVEQNQSTTEIQNGTGGRSDLECGNS